MTKRLVDEKDCVCAYRVNDDHDGKICDVAQYYLFDWDNNILNMPTKVCFEKQNEKGEWELHRLSTDDYAKFRHDKSWRPPNNDFSKAFEDFSDTGSRGPTAFIEDVKIALKAIEDGETPPHSFAKFKKALIEGRLFAIITARGHAQHTIREGVEYFVEKMLTKEEKNKMIENLKKFRCHFDGNCDDDKISSEQIIKEYLDLNRFRGVSNPDFQREMNLVEGANSPEEGKKAAIHEFVHHIGELLKKADKHESLKISFGFSDDDKKNVCVVREFLEKELALEFPKVKFVVYDTSDPKIGRKILVSPGNSPVKQVNKRARNIEKK